MAFTHHTAALWCIAGGWKTLIVSEMPTSYLSSELNFIDIWRESRVRGCVGEVLHHDGIHVRQVMSDPCPRDNHSCLGADVVAFNHLTRGTCC